MNKIGIEYATPVAADKDEDYYKNMEILPEYQEQAIKEGDDVLF